MSYIIYRERLVTKKNGAIPQGYMTVGELAKTMKTTVRTLQYYDKEGLLKPSSESEGGRRLYKHNDIFKLHQIQSMKFLGFSLKEIKDRLVTPYSKPDVASALTEQAKAIRLKMESLLKVAPFLFWGLHSKKTVRTRAIQR